MIDFLCTEAACSPVVRLGQILVSVFLAILFLQSGIDKVTDRKGNLEWLTGHFSGSPLARHVPRLLTIVTACELLAGVLSALGVLGLLILSEEGIALAGLAFSALSLLMLFFGQRMAKDYEGAAVLASYFTLVLVGIYLFS